MTQPTTPATDLLSYVDVEELTGTKSEPDSIERKRLVVFCRRAQAEIRSRVVGVDARIAAHSLDAELVKGTAVDMVIAALEDLDVGWRVAQEQYPESTTQYSTPAAAARSLIRMSDEQVQQLAPPAAGSAGLYILPLGG